MKVQLKWKSENNDENLLQVTDRVFIGRTCPGAIESKRIIIQDKAVSRDHASVTFTPQGVFIMDTSSNGTQVNNVRISSGMNILLNDGDQISISSQVIQVQIIQDERSDKGSQVSDHNITATHIFPSTKIVTNMVMDVRGFSTLTQQVESDRVYAFMNSIFEHVTEIVHQQGGTVKDNIGDSIFAFWEHGNQESPEIASAACTSAALQHNQINKMLLTEDPVFQNIKLGWGLATGNVTLSNYRLRSSDLAVVGDSTNLAFRLCDKANKELPAPIVLCSRTAQLIKDTLAVSELGEVATKGREGKERVYTLENLE